MHFLVIGDSPLSFLWSTTLLRNSHVVSHLHNSPTLSKVVETQQGILVKDDNDKSDLVPLPLSLTFEESLKGLVDGEKKNPTPHIDAIILFTSTAETERRLNEMQPKLQKFIDLNLTFVCLQDGLGNVEILAQSVPRNNMLVGSTVTHATAIREGVIRGTTNRPTSVWSASRLVSEHMRDIVKAFSSAGFSTLASPEAEIMLWKKLAVNCSLNVLSAICSIKIGSVWNDGNNSGRDTAVQVAREVARVAQLEGVKLPEQEVVDTVAFVGQKASNRVSDMCNDLLNQRTTGIESLNGYVLRCAKKHNFPVHTTQNLYNIVKLLEDTYGKRLKPLVGVFEGEEVQK